MDADELEARRQAALARMPRRHKVARWWAIHWPPLFVTALIVTLMIVAGVMVYRVWKYT